MATQGSLRTVERQQRINEELQDYIKGQLNAASLQNTGTKVRNAIEQHAQIRSRDLNESDKGYSDVLHAQEVNNKMLQFRGRVQEAKNTASELLSKRKDDVYTNAPSREE
eukprot:scpid107674/ scgid25625/ 